MNTIVSYLVTFFSGLIIGILTTYFGNRLFEKAKQKDSEKAMIKKFQNIKSKMPEFLKEMKTDLTNPSMNLCREFIILQSRNVVISSIERPAFAYYENEHDNLISKLLILERAEFIFDKTIGDFPRYQFDEKFIDLLCSDK